MKNKAFTLIELLVVISIIAIIASLAIPSLVGSIERARALSDASNLKQLGVGIVQYTNENDDDFFPVAGGSKPWPQLVQAYVPDWKAFQSPFDRRPVKTSPPYNVSYGINQGVFGINRSKFTNPSQLIIAAASVTTANQLTFNGDSASDVKITPRLGLGTYRNRKQMNALFSDSHVAPLTLVQYQDSGPEGDRRWQFDAPP